LKALAEKEKSEPQIRLLICRDCKTIEELPDFDGPPEYDTLLQIATERHQKPGPHLGNLMKFPLKYWAREDVKQEILKQIKQGAGAGLDVFGTDFYATKSQFHEDAMSCFALHLRPSSGCSDYKTERKELKPDTAKERQDLGMTGSRPKIYLCDFCPAKMHYQKKSFTEKGLYK
jgi:hypothetical protein